MPESLPVVFLMGPTGCGKSDLAVALCRRIPCEIISVDSMLVYRSMDIGTAKPARAVRTHFPHHLIDILDPGEKYSAARFRDDARRIIPQIHSRQRVPLLTGGTMFYFHALEYGLDAMPDIADTVEAGIRHLEEAGGTGFLYRMLRCVDAETARNLHPHDAQRIKRALGIVLSSGQSLSDFHNDVTDMLPHHVVKFALNYRRRLTLHQRIERRFTSMLRNGLINETIQLLLRGDLAAQLPAMRAVGYAQVQAYLTGVIDFETMRHRAICATRQLIKRQLTWLRSMHGVREYFVDEESIEAILHDMLSCIERIR